MDSKQDNTVKSTCSVINHKFVTSDSTSVIAVYGHDNSRTIYIESGHKEKRMMTRYQILFQKGRYQSDAGGSWSISTPTISSKIAAEIRELRKISQTQDEYQVTNDEMQSFKVIMDKAANKALIPNGDQDYAIETGLKAIGKNRSNEHSCILC